MNTYKRHRFPPDIISYAVWLYDRMVPSLGRSSLTSYAITVLPKVRTDEDCDPITGMPRTGNIPVAISPCQGGCDSTAPGNPF